jgi:PAS domain S-box-containing protein
MVMSTLAIRVTENQGWLMSRILRYAKDRGYTKYTSTLEEAWRLSIVGLSNALVEMLQRQGDAFELGPDEDFQQDPAAAFGVLEAKKHRARGIPLTMFLGLMKYYRQTYQDLVQESGWETEEEHQARRIVDRFFDRVEIAFCAEWAGASPVKLDAELQSSNRKMTNEKNKYLTIFESLASPVLLFDAENRLDSLNHAAAVFFNLSHSPGRAYYSSDTTHPTPPALSEALNRFSTSEEPEQISERELVVSGQSHFLRIHLKRMLDVSQKFQGTVVILTDLTERQQAAREREQLIQQLQEALGNVKTLSGLLPICAACKKIRDDKGYWSSVESYVQQHSDARFTHGFCPDCATRLYPGLVLSAAS